MGGILRAIGALITGAAQREHTPIRKGFAKARKILYEQKDLDRAVKHLKGKTIAEIKVWDKQGENAIQKLEEDLKEMVQHEIQILHFIIQTLRQIIVKDDQIKAQVPTIASYEERAKKEFAEIMQLPFTMQHFAQFTEQSHINKHYFARHLFHEFKHLLKDEKTLDKGLDKFSEGLERHILPDVQEGEGSAEDAIEKFYEALKDILKSTLALTYAVVGEVKDFIKANKTLEPKYREAIKDEKWAEQMLAKIQSESIESIKALRTTDQLTR